LYRPVVGRRVCGVAVKAQRPQAEPRTYGLEGGVVHAMLIEPGRRNVRTSEDRVVAFGVVHGEGQAEGFGCRLSIRPATGVQGDP
jgi:hypothetical protein